MRHTLLAAALLAAGFFVSPAWSAPDAPVAETELDPVVVTATRTEQPASETLAPVTVITRADIERLQPRTLTELLAGQAGIAIANNGGEGQLTSLFMRGTNSGHTLVLIDGVRMGSITSGGAAWEQLPLAQIERIEVVRGPRSALYGADAVGGVVQIFTRRGGADGLTPALRVSGGSQGSWRTLAGLSGGDEDGWFNVSLGAQRTRGFNSCRVGAGTVFAGCFTDEPDRDGYRAYSALLSGGLQWDGGATLQGNFFRNTNFVEYDGDFSNWSRHAQQVMGAELALPLAAHWQMLFTAGRSDDKATDWLDPHQRGVRRSYVAFLDSRRTQAGWLNRLRLAPGQQLDLGVDWQRESLASDTAYAASARHNRAAFARWEGRFGAQELQLSARRDRNQQFGSHGTGAVAWGWHLDERLTLRASWATAFHAPTFNDLYYPSFPGFPPSADPELRPEKARNAELGLSGRHAAWHWQASAWDNRITDLIALDENFTPGNISRARIRGVEAEVGGAHAGWRWSGAATWLRAENRAGGAEQGKRLPRRPGRTLRVDIDRELAAHLDLGATLRLAGPSWDDAGNFTRLGGHGVLDLRTGWQVTPRWRGELALHNALDRRYETVYYYNQPGRQFMATLRFVP